MELKFFMDKIAELEEYLKTTCVNPDSYLDKFDYLSDERFGEICKSIKENYQSKYGRHFPLIGDFEAIREATQKISTYKETKRDDNLDNSTIAEMCQSIIKSLDARKEKYMSEFEKELKAKNPVALQQKRTNDVIDHKARIKNYHEMGMVYSRVENRQVDKSAMPTIGGEFIDMFTQEKFSFPEYTEPKF